MRTIIIFIFFALVYSCSDNRNVLTKPIEFTKIDSISTLQELRQFVKKTDSSLSAFLPRSPKFYGTQGNHHVSILKRRLDSMFPDFTFIKEDFDRNGYTDLVITGEYYQNSLEVIAIMNSGKETYRTIRLTLREPEHFPVYPKLVYKNKLPVIELYSSYNFAKNQENGVSKNTLVYKFGTFIDYVESSEKYKISKIEFSTNGCHGACPVFEIILNKKSKSIFKAKYYNFSKEPIADIKKEEGNFETMIHEENYTEIFKIIEYLQLKNYDDNYFTGSFHYPSCILKVYFTDGTIKVINDHGMIGTNGLYYLYQKLYDLRFNQNWKEVDTN